MEAVREINIDGRWYIIVGLEDEGKSYRLCDAYGREKVMNLDELVEKCSDLA